MKINKKNIKLNFYKIMIFIVFLIFLNNQILQANDKPPEREKTKVTLQEFFLQQWKDTTEGLKQKVNDKIKGIGMELVMKGLDIAVAQDIPIFSVVGSFFGLGGNNNSNSVDLENIIKMQTQKIIEAINESDLYVTGYVSDLFIQKTEVDYDAFIENVQDYDWDYEWAEAEWPNGFTTFDIWADRQSAEDRRDRASDVRIALQRDWGNQSQYELFQYYLDTVGMAITYDQEFDRLDYIYNMALSSSTACVSQKGAVLCGIDSYDQTYKAYMTQDSIYDTINDAIDHIASLSDPQNPQKSWRIASDARFKDLIQLPEVATSCSNNPYNIAPDLCDGYELTSTVWQYKIFDRAADKLYEIKVTKQDCFYDTYVYIIETPFNIPDDFEYLEDLGIYSQHFTHPNRMECHEGSLEGIGIEGVINALIEVHKDIEYIPYLQAGFEPAIEIMENWWKLAGNPGTRRANLPMQADYDLEAYYAQNTWIINEPNVTLNSLYNAPSDVIVKSGGKLTINNNVQLKVYGTRKFTVEPGGSLSMTNEAKITAM